MRAALRARSTDGHQVALAATAVAVAAWGLGPVIVRSISADLPATLFWRLWLSVPLWVAIAWKSDPHFSLRRVAAIWQPSVLFFGSMVASFASYRMTSIANASLIGSMTPLVIFGFARRHFGERIGARLAALGAAAAIGTTLVILGAGKTSGATLGGDALALAALVSFSLYFMLAKRMRAGGMPTGTLLCAVFTWSAVLATPYALLRSRDLTISAKDFALAGLLVLGPGLVGHGLITWAQQRVAITTSSLMTLGSPVVSTVAAWLINHQRLSWTQAIGIVVVLVALAVATLIATPRVPPPGELLAEQSGDTLAPVETAG